jgi:hypothetical protein
MAETHPAAADKAQKPATPSPLTQDEVDRLNSMEQEWAASIDKAVPFIRQKKSRNALANTKKAAAVISGMKSLLVKKGYNVGAIDRLVAMESLTDAYSNMAKIAGYTREPYITINDFKKMRSLFDDTRGKLLVAEAKFHELPKIQEMCRQFLGLLDDFEREVKKVSGMR